ncbi:MAG: glycosyltransferase family 39 protein [Muribaculaceae bacterium]|nr:glycosyltransferase family 39 protein [Muribaculaceae bacterium]
MLRRDQTHMPGAQWIVFIALALMLLPWLGITLFYSKGEPREAIVAMSMLQSGDWILPLSYGQDMPYKPPFMAWIIASLAWLLNGGVVNEYIARLPSALAAIAMTMGGFVWTRRAAGTRFAIIYAFVTACSFEVFRAASACRVDMILTACMVGALYIMYNISEYEHRHKGRLYLAAIVLLTCATLTKGPVGALLPCFAFGIFRLLRGDSFAPTFFRMLGLAVLAIALTSWWYVLAWQRGGDDFYHLMYEENIDRLLGKMSYESHVKPFWYNFVTLIAGLLPWTLLLLATSFSLRRARFARLKAPGLLCAVVAVVVVGFFCIPASKRSVYLLPAYPFICYGIACILNTKSPAGAIRFFAWLMSVLAVAAPLAIVALQIWPQPELTLAPVPWWGYIVLAMPLLAGIAWMCNRHSPVGHTLVCVWALLTAYMAAGMPAVLNPKSDFRAVARLTSDPEATVISANSVYGPYRYYSLNFYLGDRIRQVSPEQAAQYPQGTLLLCPANADTAGLAPYYTFEPLLERSADHRDPTVLGVRK